MAPTSRIILTRHAQAEHNVDLDYTIPDAPLTPLGKKQAAALVPQVADIVNEVDLVASSPLKRTLQTTKLGWASAVERLGGLSKVVLVPEFQECNDFPCDTGSAKEVLEQDVELKGFNFSDLPSDWTSKQGFWSADRGLIAKRAKWVRHWLRDRPEKTIVLVGHGDILRELTASSDGASGYMWRNAEARIFTFDPETVDKDECFLLQEKGKEVAVAGGYGPTSTEEDIVANGKL
ncbi:Putative histidine phosphatase superfamily, clade-1 [Septoria linicola]|uniref:Histidine phosphatase superfamily, clade-1 n=1 Tax=Septoria linicola TaxID=215465 RepID=A0A9Q9B7V8_9PEZI|nr:putative histidine phosphatase superfamily, clade-1 [Septoria linicola]USW59023.1 Putative histidine phosphatase superfamily, clade-1 [Septoria linicola]